MAVRRHFNALGVTESDVIVDWLYKSKHQGMARSVAFDERAAANTRRRRVQSPIRTATEMIPHHITSHTHFAALTAFLHDTQVWQSSAYTTTTCMSIGSAFWDTYYYNWAGITTPAAGSWAGHDLGKVEC